MKKRSHVIAISLLGIGVLLLAAFDQFSKRTSLEQLRYEPLDLQVEVIQQAKSTSCGEAVIVMAYNYAHPQTRLIELQVIDYATEQGYFTEDVPPFTSPGNMVKIARHHADRISTGTVLSSTQGLFLLLQRLKAGEPVIIDVLSDFSDPHSEAHFILITGISMDSNRENTIIIHYNDPLTGTKEMAEWSGKDGIWQAWQNNGDPGGSGWWMVIPP